MLNRYLLSSRTFSVLAISTATAAAQPVSDNLGIVSHSSYARFKSAMAMSSYAMTDYALAENPRVAATVTAGLVFLSVNPLVSEAQLTDYIARFSADLAAYEPSDPNLLRSESFFAAVRSMDAGPSGFATDGLDTRVSKRVLEALRVGVRQPLDFQSTQQRMVAFENSRVRSFTNAPELPLILTHGLMGNDIDGNRPRFISSTGVIQAFLISEGFEIIPDGVDDERFDLVTPALMSMPADFDDYMAFQASIDPMDVSASSAHAEIMGALDGLKVNGDELQVELAAKVAQGTSILEAAANAEDPVIVEQVLDELREDIRQDSGYWTDLQWRTMLMLQSQQDEVRSYSTSVRSFAHVRLETNNEFFTAKKGTELATGAVIAFAQFKSGDVLDSVSWAITSGIEIADAFGLFGDSPPSAEEQIFDQIVEVRMDIENLRVEMHDRFNRLESTLNQIQLSMNSSFAQIGNAIGELSADVEDLSRDIAVSRSILDRIEDALYRMASDAFWNDFAVKVNLVLNYRSGGIDLPYGNTSPSFLESASSIYSFNTGTAALEAFAGPDAPGSATFDDAQSVLNGQSIGRDINYLRSLPPRLSSALQPLTLSRVVALGPWAQSATVYAQLARENPWYFGYLYENQTMNPGQTNLDAIIEKGEDLNEMMSAGRSQALFDEVILGYDGEIQDLQARETQLIDAANSFVAGSISFDIFAEPPYISEDARLAAPTPAPLDDVYGSLGLTFDYLTGFPENWWYLFGVDDGGQFEDIAPLLYHLVTSISFEAGQPAVFTYEIGWERTFLSRQLVIWVRFHGDGSGIGVDPDFEFVRQIYVNFPDNYISNVLGGAGLSTAVNQEIAAYDAWRAMAAAPFTRTNLAGTNYVFGGGNQYVFYVPLDNESISTSSGAPYRSNAREKLEELLEYKQVRLWESLRDDGVIETESDQLNDWAAIAEAYATLSMPDMLAESDVARAALRGLSSGPVSVSDPTIVDYRDSSALALDVQAFYEQNRVDPQNAISVTERIAPSVSLFLDTLYTWIDLPYNGHAYLNYTLADLRDLRDNAFNLAVDDMYSDPVHVTAENGLLANDIDQDYRAIEIQSYTQPADGTVVVNPDGSFTYSPPLFFYGTTSFTYTASAVITEIDGEPQSFVSDPATVVFRIHGIDYCPPDVNGDGVLSAADFTAWINAFNNNLPLCDQNFDGSCTPTDFTAWIANYNVGCGV
ncbi:MAG: hypothetical protein Phyf2KO_00870 [Phycisphaerales bacterium]